MSPVTFDEIVCTGNENARIMARHLALESPTVPRPLAIPHTEIASYPREWRDDTHSGKYSYIPSYMGWHRGEQLELAGPSIPAERPLSLVPGPSNQPESIE